MLLSAYRPESVFCLFPPENSVNAALFIFPYISANLPSSCTAILPSRTHPVYSLDAFLHAMENIGIGYREIQASFPADPVYTFYEMRQKWIKYVLAEQK